MVAYHQPINHKRKQKYTTAQVQGWRKTMRENGWSYTQLAEHLNIGVKNLTRVFQQEAFGELRE